MALLFLPLFGASPATGPSFDCHKAQSFVEKSICSDEALAALDLRMSEAFKSVVSQSAPATSLRAEQREWIKVRDACTEIACIKASYESRLGVLESWDPQGVKELDSMVGTHQRASRCAECKPDCMQVKRISATRAQLFVFASGANSHACGAESLELVSLFPIRFANADGAIEVEVDGGKLILHEVQSDRIGSAFCGANASLDDLAFPKAAKDGDPGCSWKE